ncbi:uncharacterized protein LOC119655044 [Hermetia illucens]|uniref:uncharacterized protein LOC119655044 n=1 Tax=Hermetia illucens TaxID=343691 RepID=UPI0018CC4DD6|nr:uncharacterized protein LOC119655044 [Hermetia illucens]
MPSLQQFNSTDCPSPDARSLTGPDILHRHSINSLLERHELINRGLSSPIEGETLSIPDLLGIGSSRNSLFGSQTGSISPSPNNYASLMTSSTGSSISPGISMSSTQNFDAFSVIYGKNSCTVISLSKRK